VGPSFVAGGRSARRPSSALASPHLRTRRRPILHGRCPVRATNRAAPPTYPTHDPSAVRARPDPRRSQAIPDVDLRDFQDRMRLSTNKMPPWPIPEGSANTRPRRGGDIPQDLRADEDGVSCHPVKPAGPADRRGAGRRR
jgi:hypothetical protein